MIIDIDYIEFFRWLKSINKLDFYEAVLDISEDYGLDDQNHRMNAFNEIEKLKQEYSKSNDNQRRNTKI